jgi:beta-galactosidase/beta-glucuronidase
LRKILVPFCPESSLSGIGEKDFMPCVWYRRRFALPESWRGMRVLLHFGAVDYEAAAWVNGREVGRHRGGYSSFAFEITAALKGGWNELVVRAMDDTRSPLQPAGKQSKRFESWGCLYTRTTGIWQTVWLEAVPATHIRGFRLYPGAKSLGIHANVHGPADGLVFAAVAKAGGQEVGRVEIPATGSAVFDLPLSFVRHWEPGNPFLYDLELRLMKGRRALDTVHSYFGLRTIRIEGKKVLINEKPVFQRLVLDQGFYPDGIYTAPSDAALRRDIELALDLGFNGARLHEKIFEPRLLYWADRLGYLVWSEYPDWGLDLANPLALERVLPEWTETVERDFNHPAIVGWCPFNETSSAQNPELLRTVHRLTKQLDPTRPAHDTSGYVHVGDTDIYDNHIYEQDPVKFAERFEAFKSDDSDMKPFSRNDVSVYRGQPFFVSEYGGIWWNPSQKDEKAWGYGGEKARPRTEEEFVARYRALTETLLSHPKMFGFCYTQLTDVEQEVNGLYTYDRRPKFDARLIREINTQKAAIEGE